jgi:phospholipase/carboxylesterase
VKTKPPVLLVHGDSDQVLPVASIYDAERRLKVLGFDVASHVSSGLTHSIDDAGLQLGGRFLIEKLS